MATLVRDKIARWCIRGRLRRFEDAMSVLLPQNGDVIEMGRERFEELVSDALDQVPEELAVLMDNVVVMVEDDGPEDDPHLLGLYDGTPLTERDSTYAMVVPDRITIFRNPTLEMCESDQEVVDEVRITVVHEIAHHFGIEDDRLHDLGYA
jgi:predicted Zn-dependent protease with MMP-like domain